MYRIIEQNYEEQKANSSASILPNQKIEHIIFDIMSDLSKKQDQTWKKSNEKKHENLSKYLTNVMCCSNITMDRFKRNMHQTQHRIAKEIFHWEKIGERLQNCQDYHSNLSIFFQVSRVEQNSPLRTVKIKID